jgi:hypothetical protein
MTIPTDPPSSTPAIVCDMTDAPDTPAERLAEYGRLFTAALVGRERTGDGIRFRFRADAGVENWVRDLAAREKACCGFFTFATAMHGDEVWWDASVVDDDGARAILDEFYRLPETVGEGVGEVFDRMNDRGLQVMIEEDGVRRTVSRREIVTDP